MVDDFSEWQTGCLNGTVIVPQQPDKSFKRVWTGRTLVVHELLSDQATLSGGKWY